MRLTACSSSPGSSPFSLSRKQHELLRKKIGISREQYTSGMHVLLASEILVALRIDRTM
jgi:hypothetical protein